MAGSLWTNPLVQPTRRRPRPLASGRSRRPLDISTDYHQFSTPAAGENDNIKGGRAEGIRVPNPSPPGSRILLFQHGAMEWNWEDTHHINTGAQVPFRPHVGQHGGGCWLGIKLGQQTWRRMRRGGLL